MTVTNQAQLPPCEQRVRRMAEVIVSSNLSTNEADLAEYLRTNIVRIVQEDRAAAGDTGQAQIIYADGYCARCSELSRPLTRALADQGVPTGEDGWQQDFGPNMVRRQSDSDTSLRRLLIALEKGDKDSIDAEVTRANGYLETHRAIGRKLAAQAQQRHREQESRTPSPVPDEKCASHCEHSPAWMKAGACTAFVGDSILAGVSECGHRCTPVEDEKCPGCHHERRFFNEVDGTCMCPLPADDVGTLCLHRCDLNLRRSKTL